MRFAIDDLRRAMSQMQVHVHIHQPDVPTKPSTGDGVDDSLLSGQDPELVRLALKNLASQPRLIPS